MGFQAFKELWDRRDKYDIVLLLLPGKYEKKVFMHYENEACIKSISGRGVAEGLGLKIVWGDLTDYKDVLEAVQGVDHVLHPAAFVAPGADHDPFLARKINVDGTENIIKAIKSQPRGAERISIVNVGSVACYGDRLPPVALIKAGDPIMPSVFDFYALTKIAAERAVIESGIKHWVSLRQTYICSPDTAALMDPIMFHQPIETHIEMNTCADAGYGIVQTLKQDLDSDFWCRVYNQGGGPSCRFVYLDYLKRMMRLMGVGDYRKLMERNWFCLRNFHCGWFADSDVINGYLGNWRQSLEDHYDQVKEALPWHAALRRFVPKALIRRFVLERMANSKDGPQHWVKHPNEMPNRIKAFYGSLEKYDEMGGWGWKMPAEMIESHILDQGYDESRSLDDLSINELKEAARFRGGACLSDSYCGQRAERLRWRCSFGHQFNASVALILLGGHWCPECVAPPWNYDEIASKNPFLAQAYYNTHDKSENNLYTEEDCLKETF